MKRFLIQSAIFIVYCIVFGIVAHMLGAAAFYYSENLWIGVGTNTGFIFLFLCLFFIVTRRNRP
ncbi:hypothetical protein YOLOSWAG_51 [Erwinia phage vB_EamM_Yoloswag]|uniref:Uncharacterized protein n=1 Tax=Erwinia phage vB_EamM_Yoloswag TaxID=1958956 RepID=A0A1S6L2X2_9CAUD|nr:hypothetical protein HOR66_gp051 [Erwinia phage vB_EamM_Yoloswag]AQT28535.1 hypothetical protein YOLOSWAG_51 [Erwinia phage vB_EamM_Yoloswag]